MDEEMRNAVVLLMTYMAIPVTVSLKWVLAYRLS